MGNNKFYLYLILVLFLIVFIGSGLYLFFVKNPAVKKEGAAFVKGEKLIIPTAPVTRGFLNIKLPEDAKASYLAGETVNLQLVGDSDSEDISAFDVLLGYDILAFDFVKANSVSSMYRVFTFKKDNQLRLTVARIAKTTEKSVFSNSPLINLVFTSKKSGEFVFGIIPASGKETTKFVNDKTETIYPKVNDLRITVN